MCQTNCAAVSAPPAWHERETMRFTSGYYLPVPVTVYKPYPAEHFLHLSTTATEQDFIAYTPSDQYGQADRQVRLKFGRYLKKFFPEMSDHAIQSYVTELKSALAIADNPATLHFTTERETISRIFETRMCTCGSSYDSCMYDKFTHLDVRPYHVYADSPDVAVAYVTSGADNDIISRSVVSTKDKVWVRAYSIASGDNDADCGTLKELLKQAGYTKGELTGNRLTKVEWPSGEVMLPYIDNGGAHVRDEGKYWEVVEDGEGDWEADNTDGTATSCSNRCETCNERQDDCECSYCECCETHSRYGCNNCSFCEVCEGCEQHDGCDCDRCSNCNNYMPNGRLTRHVTTCDCDRCSECNELEDECECEKCSECGELKSDCECEPESAEPMPVDEAMLELADSDAHARNMAMTNYDIKHKLNRIYVYIRDSRNYPDNHNPEFELLMPVFRTIPYGEN